MRSTHKTPPHKILHRFLQFCIGNIAIKMGTKTNLKNFLCMSLSGVVSLQCHRKKPASPEVLEFGYRLAS